ncbi:MAG: LppU/SCO3897 family protein [Propionibacteriaceae bacterium]
MSTPQNPQQPDFQPQAPHAPEGYVQDPTTVQAGYTSQEQPMPQTGYMQQENLQTTTPAKKPGFFKSSLGKAIVGILLVALSTGGIYVWRLLKGENIDGTMKEGSCYTIAVQSSGKSDADFKKIDCSDTSKMNFLITKEGTGVASATSCGDNEYTFSYTFTKRGSTTHKYSCLMPNFAEGKCYYEPDNGTPDMIDCADSKAMIKVTQRIDSKNDTAACADGQGLGYAHPERTYCVGDPQK